MATAPDLQTPWSATDVWSGLDHKQGMGFNARTGHVGSWLAPSWINVGNNARRLTAYKILEDYYKNKARVWLNTEDEDVKREHRELGDAQLIIEATLAALCGDDQQIFVDGADDEANTAEIELQEFFDNWAKAERFRAKLKAVERDSVKLGDGVYVLEADPRRKRVRLRKMNPGFYFPVLDPNLPEDDFPEVVHLAWEYEAPIGSGQMWVRRITYRMGPIMPKRDIDGLPLLDENSAPLLFDGDSLDLDRGTITRDLPWNDEATDVTCYMSNGVWKLEDVDGYNVFNFPTSSVTWAVDANGDTMNDLDLGYDFIPVVHIPNTVEIEDHFGTAVITPIAQTLDELAAADSDAAKAAALAGVPAVVVKGVGVKSMSIKPGAVIPIGEDADFEVVDLSPALTAIMGYVTATQKRASENARVPDEWLGRVKSSEVPSGFALAMGFSPLRSLIDDMRLTREEKYPLLLKFVQRISILNGWLTGEVLDVDVVFGSFLPSDEPRMIETVTKLYGDHLISRKTAIGMLLDAGIIDVDLEQELVDAQAEDFEMALQLLEATQDDLDAVYEFLDRERPEEDPNAGDVQVDIATGLPLVVDDEEQLDDADA